MTNCRAKLSETWDSVGRYKCTVENAWGPFVRPCSDQCCFGATRCNSDFSEHTISKKKAPAFSEDSFSAELSTHVSHDNLMGKH